MWPFTKSSSERALDALEAQLEQKGLRGEIVRDTGEKRFFTCAYPNCGEILTQSRVIVPYYYDGAAGLGGWGTASEWRPSRLTLLDGNPVCEAHAKLLKGGEIHENPTRR